MITEAWWSYENGGSYKRATGFAPPREARILCAEQLTLLKYPRPALATDAATSA
jgi:hypothetical protein